jgi:general secretion pathway protein E
MGVEPFLVASSLIGVLAQRLVRVLCKDCRTPYLPTPEELKEIGLTPEAVREGSGGMLYKPVGCEQCNKTGYHGRSGIYEMMLMDDDLRQLTLKNVDSGTIKRQAVNKGMRTLMDDGAQKVLRGVTSVAEVLSVTQEDTA